MLCSPLFGKPRVCNISSVFLLGFLSFSRSRIYEFEFVFHFVREFSFLLPSVVAFVAGEWIYAFLDTSKSLAPANYIGVAILIVVVFVVAKLIVQWRRCCCSHGVDDAVDMVSPRLAFPVRQRSGLNISPMDIEGDSLKLTELQEIAHPTG